MGMFDTVEVRCELPTNAPEFVVRSPVFQTYDLGRGMNDYAITKDKRLVITRSCIEAILMKAFKTPKDVAEQIKKHVTPLTYRRKRLELYASNLRGGKPMGKKKKWQVFTANGEQMVEVTYVVQIRDGLVSSIKEKHRRVEDALPMSKFR